MAGNLETVVVIPKVTSPEELGDLRLLSCTALFSKLMESYVLERMKKEVIIGSNQYGGQKKCSTQHYLVRMWNEVLESLEEPGYAVSVLAINFRKAFNSVRHDACIEALKNHGASPFTTEMAHAFLQGRKMRARIGGTLSEDLPICGGSPQGTLLGNFLLVVVTDRLEQTGAHVENV